MRPLFVVAFVVLASSVGSCLDPTQVDLQITTNMPCGPGSEYPRLLGTEIKTGTSLADLESVATTTECRGSNRVGNLVLVPGSGEQVYVQVTGRVATSATQQVDLPASRVIRYISHQRLELPIDLSAECIGKVCDPNQTCSKGMCIDKETKGCRGAECDAGGMPDATVIKDSGIDGFSLSDAPIDAIPDTMFDAIGTGDAGPCSQLPFLSMYDFYWPFSEMMGSMSVTEMVTNTKTQLATAKTGTGGFCGNALLLSSLPTQNLSACNTNSCFPGGQLKIAFALKLGSGTGLVLGHTAQMKGSWAIQVAAGPVIRFGVDYLGGQFSYIQGASVPLNKWCHVVAAANVGGYAISVDGSPVQTSGQFASLPAEGPYAVSVGAQTIDYAIDELFISSK